MPLFSNYGGPGGSGPTLHESDRAFKEHDENYNFKKYFYFNNADKVLLKRLKNIKTQSKREFVINKLATGYFSAKKYVMWPNFRGSGSSKRNRSEGYYIRRDRPVNTLLRNDAALDRTYVNNTSTHRTKLMKSIRERGSYKKPKLSMKTLVKEKYKPFSITMHSYGCANGPVPLLIYNDLTSDVQKFQWAGIPATCFTLQGAAIANMLSNQFTAPRYLKFHGCSGRYLLWPEVPLGTIAPDNWRYRWSDPNYGAPGSNWDPSTATCPNDRKLQWGRDMVPTFSFVHGATYDPVHAPITPATAATPTSEVNQTFGPAPKFCTGLTLYDLMKKSFDHFNLTHADASKYNEYSTYFQNNFDAFITVDKPGPVVGMQVPSYNIAAQPGPSITDMQFNDESFFKTCSFYYNGGYTEHTFINSNTFAVTLLVAECVPKNNIYESIGTHWYNTPNFTLGGNDPSSTPNNNATMLPARQDPMLPQEMACYDKLVQMLNRNVNDPLMNILGESTLKDNLFPTIQAGTTATSTSTAVGSQVTFVEGLAYTNSWKPYSNYYPTQSKNYAISKRYVKLEPGETFKYKVHHNPFKLSSDEWHELQSTYNLLSPSESSQPSGQQKMYVTNMMNHPIITKFFSKVLEVTVLAQKGNTNFDENLEAPPLPGASESANYLYTSGGAFVTSDVNKINPATASSVDRMPGTISHNQKESHNCAFSLKEPRTTSIVVNRLVEDNDWLMQGADNISTVFVNPESNTVVKAEDTSKSQGDL